MAGHFDSGGKGGVVERTLRKVGWGVETRWFWADFAALPRRGRWHHSIVKRNTNVERGRPKNVMEIGRGPVKKGAAFQEGMGGEEMRESFRLAYQDSRG